MNLTVLNFPQLYFFNFVIGWLIVSNKKRWKDRTVIDLGIHLIQPQICNSLSNLYNVSKYKLTLTPPVHLNRWAKEIGDPSRSSDSLFLIEVAMRAERRHLFPGEWGAYFIIRCDYKIEPTCFTVPQASQEDKRH